MKTNHRIGWLGTGRMGAAMAARLISDGATVTVWNRTASKTQPLVELGATRADTISDLGQCDIVFTSVTSSPDLLDGDAGSRRPVRRAAAAEHRCGHLHRVRRGRRRSQSRGRPNRGIGFLSHRSAATPTSSPMDSASIIASGPKSVFDIVLPYLTRLHPG